MIENQLQILLNDLSCQKKISSENIKRFIAYYYRCNIFYTFCFEIPVFWEIYKHTHIYRIGIKIKQLKNLFKQELLIRGNKIQ